jgi:hypothetical protein
MNFDDVEGFQKMQAILAEREQLYLEEKKKKEEEINNILEQP